MNPLLEQRNAPKPRKPLIHLLVQDVKGKIMSKGAPTLASGNPGIPKDGQHRWSPACGSEIVMAPGSLDVCTGDAMAVSCPKCLDSDKFWEEAKRQYPQVVEAVEESEQSEDSQEEEVPEV